MIIEKMNGEYAVLMTDEGPINVHRAHLPSAARVGDTVSYSNGGYSIDRRQPDDLGSEVRDKLRELLTGKYD